MPSSDIGATESLLLPKECEKDIDGMRSRVQGRVEKCPVPSSGSILTFSPVYGCDDLASHTISNASKVYHDLFVGSRGLC